MKTGSKKSKGELLSVSRGFLTHKNYRLHRSEGKMEYSKRTKVEGRI